MCPVESVVVWNASTPTSQQTFCWIWSVCRLRWQPYGTRSELYSCTLLVAPFSYSPQSWMDRNVLWCRRYQSRIDRQTNPVCTRYTRRKNAPNALRKWSSVASIWAGVRSLYSNNGWLTVPIPSHTWTQRPYSAWEIRWFFVNCAALLDMVAACSRCRRASHYREFVEFFPPSLRCIVHSL